MRQEVPEAVTKLHDLFRQKQLTLSIAESCTGGLIGHYLTALPGASSFFIGGIIAYSAETKNNILGVSQQAIIRYGVVSDQTAREMAEKIRLLTDTDYSLSTTGNLGPDVLEGKERGLIYVAAGSKEKTVSRELRLSGDRDENKHDAALHAILLLIELVETETHLSA